MIFLVFVPLAAFAQSANSTNSPDDPTAYGVVQSVADKPEQALVHVESPEGPGAKSALRMRTLRLGSIFLACVIGGMLLVLLFRRSDGHRKEIDRVSELPSASKSKESPAPAKTQQTLWWVAGFMVACLLGGPLLFFIRLKPPVPPPAAEPSPPMLAKPIPSALGPPPALEATALEMPPLEKTAPLEPPPLEDEMEAPSRASEERVSPQSDENVKQPENTRTSAVASTRLRDKNLVRYHGIGSEKVSIESGVAHITFTIQAYMPAHVPNRVARRLVSDAKEDFRKHIRSGKAGIQSCGEGLKARGPSPRSGVRIEMDVEVEWNLATSQRTVRVKWAPYSSFRDAALSECLAKQIQELAVPWTQGGKLNEARLKELLEHPLMSHPLTKQHSMVGVVHGNATKNGLAVDITTRGTAEVPPGFSSMFVSKNGIQEYISSKRKEIASCAAEQEARDSSLKGRMQVEVEVEWSLITSKKTSKVSSVSPDHFRGTYFADCVTQLVQAWQHVEVRRE